MHKRAFPPVFVLMAVIAPACSRPSNTSSPNGVSPFTTTTQPGTPTYPMQQSTTPVVQPVGYAPPHPLANGRPPADYAPTNAQGVPAGYRPVSDGRYSFFVPSHWESVALPTVSVALRDPNPIGGFHTNVNVTTEPYMSGDVNSYVALNLIQVRRLAVILGQRPAMVGMLPAVDVESLWPNNSPPYRTIQRFAVINGRGYVMTCSGAQATFESARPLCNSILGTFRLNP